LDRSGPGWGVGLLLIVSCVLLAFAGFLISPWLGSVAALAMLAASLFVVGGGLLLRQTLPAWAFLDARWGVDVAHGWRHDLLSLVVFVVTLGLIGSTDSLSESLSAAFRYWRLRQAAW
jgi:hypothetical protein